MWFGWCLFLQTWCVLLVFVYRCRNGKHRVDADSMCVFFKKSIYCILLECIKNACDEGKSFRWIKSVKTSLWRQEALLHEQPPPYQYAERRKREIQKIGFSKDTKQRKKKNIRILFYWIWFFFWIAFLCFT